MILAAGDRVMFYNSRNLKNWTKLSEFGVGEGTHGGVWECPELFELPVGDTGRRRWVLQVGVDPGGIYGGSGAQYFVGDFDGERFVNENPPETVLWVDRGKDFYATQDWNNVPDGRRLWIAWMNNWQYADKIPTDPWRGFMTLPRDVTLADTARGVPGWRRSPSGNSRASGAAVTSRRTSWFPKMERFEDASRRGLTAGPSR
jgi:fructan beta-fructosidase